MLPAPSLFLGINAVGSAEVKAAVSHLSHVSWNLLCLEVKDREKFSTAVMSEDRKNFLPIRKVVQEGLGIEEGTGITLNLRF